MPHPESATDAVPLAMMLAARRQAIHQRVLDGASGAEISAALTDLVDGVIVGRYREAVRSGGEQSLAAGLRHCCVVALGGYGRRELAPYSDVDVMVLYRPEAAEVAATLSREVLHHLWDSGFQVGHSVRTIADCLELGAGDLTARTSMMEARFLAGSPEFFQEFRRRYRRGVVSRGVDRYIERKLEERRREYEKYGETVYLLEPNVKKSKGGLRDLHVLQWAGMARHEAANIQELADRGILSRQDYLALIEAREFLWRVRALLHVNAGMAQEILTFDEQMRLAARFGFRDRPSLLAVEQFMQQYYRHTMGLHERCMRFVDRCRSVSVWGWLAGWLPAPRVDGCFAVAGGRLTVPQDLRTKVLESPELLLRLFDLAQCRRLLIDGELLDAIHRHVDAMPDSLFRTPEVSRTFRKILAGPGLVADTLEAMHRAHLLEKVIPVFATVRGLMQFNQYHKYTVDEHSLLAVAKAEALADDPGMLGSVYREVQQKDVLHLAILLHDLGKGREEDHSEVGKRIADEAAARLGFDEQEARTLGFLVHRHLLMAHTALRRDPYDEKVLLQFARAVGTPAVLRKLFVLTAADIAAVGPGMLTKWKESLLIELYLRTLPEVSGDRDEGAGVERLSQLAGEVVQAATGLVADTASDLAELADPAWVRTRLERFPLRYVYGTPAPRIAAHLSAIKRLGPGDVRVEDSFSEALGVCEYTVITHDNLVPGIFSKIAGVMAAKGLNILDAQIVTTEDGIVVDTFRATDPDFSGVPPLERRASVARTIGLILKGEDTVEHLMERSRRLSTTRPLPSGRQPTEVQVDNETSDRYTILDVFADDRQGLLYVITRAIFTLGLSVHAARISTRLDQVVDVFYVTDRKGGKIEERALLETIRSTVKEEIDRFLREQQTAESGEPSVSSSSSSRG